MKILGEEPDCSTVNQNASGVICLLSGYVTQNQNACWNTLTRGGLREAARHPSRLNLPQRQWKMNSIHLDCLFVGCSHDSYADLGRQPQHVTLAISLICQQRQQ